MASQITGVSIVYSTVCSGADQRKHQSSASLAFVSGIYRWQLNSPQRESVTHKIFPFDDVIMPIRILWSTYDRMALCTFTRPWPSPLVMLAWTADELSCGQASDWYTHTHTYTRTDTQTQAMTMPEGQNWPRIKSHGDIFLRRKVLFLVWRTKGTNPSNYGTPWLNMEPHNSIYGT